MLSFPIPTQIVLLIPTDVVIQYFVDIFILRDVATVSFPPLRLSPGSIVSYVLNVSFVAVNICFNFVVLLRIHYEWVFALGSDLELVSDTAEGFFAIFADTQRLSVVKFGAAIGVERRY